MGLELAKSVDLLCETTSQAFQGAINSLLDKRDMTTARRTGGETQVEALIVVNDKDLMISLGVSACWKRNAAAAVVPLWCVLLVQAIVTLLQPPVSVQPDPKGKLVVPRRIQTRCAHTRSPTHIPTSPISSPLPLRIPHLRFTPTSCPARAPHPLHQSPCVLNRHAPPFPLLRNTPRPRLQHGFSEQSASIADSCT